LRPSPFRITGGPSARTGQGLEKIDKGFKAVLKITRSEKLVEVCVDGNREFVRSEAEVSD
jgi:hypothetical protein